MYMAIAYIDAHFCTELGELGPKPTNVLDCFGMGRTWQYQSTSGVIKRGWKVPEQNGGFNGKINYCPLPRLIAGGYCTAMMIH